MTLETLKKLYKHYTETDQPGRAGQVAYKARVGYSVELSLEEKPANPEKFDSHKPVVETKSKSKK